MNSTPGACQTVPRGLPYLKDVSNNTDADIKEKGSDLLGVSALPENSEERRTPKEEHNPRPEELEKEVLPTPTTSRRESPRDHNTGQSASHVPGGT
ncbi:hypothetical protein NDU88_005946 [Pleurodeles waltl]|uniref:Prolactin receptor n=1 Tax=Pleurodeles waltl TaxID=8319 RepID=A0AAV7RPV4_PLEWA|nr:hypothetical protein NDU88_005946 [Pleurodeles waltl]